MDTMTLTSPGDPTSPSAASSAPHLAAESAPVTPSAGPRPSRRHGLRRLWRGPEADPAWARPALLGLLVATLVLYTWHLTSSGYANSFYSAAVQAGSESWKAFFFGSSDAANSITVDKPPASLWVMALSVRLLGLSSFAILFPQVLMGIATLGVVYATVKRHFGAAAGLIAGVTLALTPVAALMFTFNNPDALLTLLMALGAWATMKAIEQASPKWMMIVGVFIGLGFLTKTLQVLLVVPFFGLAYLIAAPTTLRKRLIHSLLAVGTMVLSAGWWVAIVELIPASARPYIGGSQTNSFLELTFGYNGLGRLSGDETGSIGGGGAAAGGQWGETGLLRMFSSSVGDQISWLIPSALILLAAGLWLRGRLPRTDLRRAAYLVWGGWLVVTMLVFSLMAGIFHEYYTVALAPAVAALVGMGAVEAWERRDSAVGTIALSAAIAAAATWSFILLSRTTAYGQWLRISVLALGMAAALLVLGLRWFHPRAVPVVLAAALLAGLAGPAAYTVSTTSQAHSGWLGRRTGWPPWRHAAPAAGPDRHRAARRRRDGWPARRLEPEHRCRHSALAGRAELHVGRCSRRVADRRGPAARHAAASHGDRRLQRIGPEPDPRTVPAVRRERPDPLLRQRGKGIRQPERREQLLVRDRVVGGAELHRGDAGRLDVL
jgi:4-amino-4-deoxy-L-arabinose transferase-like glycosyltransferase